MHVGETRSEAYDLARDICVDMGQYFQVRGPVVCSPDVARVYDMWPGGVWACGPVAAAVAVAAATMDAVFVLANPSRSTSVPVLLTVLQTTMPAAPPHPTCLCAAADPR